jgi:hypothetical protein
MPLDVAGHPRVTETRRLPNRLSRSAPELGLLQLAASHRKPVAVFLTCAEVVVSRRAAHLGPDGLRRNPLFDRSPGFVCATDLSTPTARPDVSERAFFLTVPFPATAKSLCGERPVDGGAAQVRCRIIETRRRPDRFPAPLALRRQSGYLEVSKGAL